MYTTKEAAQRLGVSTKMLYKAQRLGYLPKNLHPKPPDAGTLWVFTDDDLARYLREHRGRRGRRPLALLAA